MSHVLVNQTKPDFDGETLKTYRERQMEETRWEKVDIDVEEMDFINNFEFLNSAVLNRGVVHNVAGVEQQEVLMTTTGLFGPIRPGTMVHLNPDARTKDDPTHLVEQSDYAPPKEQETLIDRLNRLHDENTNNPPKDDYVLAVKGFWAAAVDGAGIPCLDGSSNVFGSTGQLICYSVESCKKNECNVESLNFPLLQYGSTEESQKLYLNTLEYYGGTLLSPNEEFTLGFSQDLWGIQYDQKLPQYITEYQFGPTKGGGLFVEHHPFPHIWLPSKGEDPKFHRQTISRILLGRRVDTALEDGYFRTIDSQLYHFTMFEIPLDGSALAIRPQCIHNDSFTSGAQTVFLANTPANTVALRHSLPINQMSVNNVPVSDLPK